jgi:hypothetical protein
MTSSPAAPGVRRTVWLAALVFLLTFTAVAGLAVTWFRTVAEPRVTLLGSGGAVSVLVTAGTSRLLIATGDNTTDFDNALGAALPPTIRRLDVLLVPGSEQGSVVAAHVLRARGARYGAFIGPPGSATRELAVSLGLDVLTAPRRYQLADGVSVTVDVGPVVSSNERVPWRATVSHGETTVIILSDGAEFANLEPAEYISALIIVRGQPGRALANANVPALMLSEDVTRKLNWREELARGTSPGLLVLAVADGEAETLRFIDRGLQIPRDAQPLPTMAPSSDDI